MSDIEYNSFEEVSCVEQDHKIKKGSTYVRWSDNFIVYSSEDSPFRNHLEVELNGSESELTLERKSDFDGPNYTAEDRLSEKDTEKVKKIIQGLDQMIGDEELREEIREDENQLNKYLSALSKISELYQ